MRYLQVRTKLIESRKRAKLTQEQLAYKVEISRAYLSNIEKGKHTPSLDVAKKIADTLNTTIDDIFFETNVRKTNKIQTA